MVKRADALTLLADEGLLDTAAEKSQGGSSQERYRSKRFHALLLRECVVESVL